MPVLYALFVRTPGATAPVNFGRSFPMGGWLSLSWEAAHEVTFKVCCTMFGGTDSASGADTSRGTNAPATASSRRDSSRKAAAPRFCVDSRVSRLEWQTICMDARAMGPSTSTRRDLGRTCLDSARRWMGVQQRILEVI